jgi:hypothetical protein
MTSWPTSHRRGAPVQTIERGSAGAGFAGYTRTAQVIDQQGNVLRTVHYDPFAKPSAPPAFKPLPATHPFRSAQAASLARARASGYGGISSRIVGITPLGIIKSIAQEALVGFMQELARQAVGHPPSDTVLGDLAAQLLGLVGPPTGWLDELLTLLISGPVPANMDFDYTKLSPGPGWTKVFEPTQAPYLEQHTAHGPATYIRAVPLAYAGSNLNLFQAQLDNFAHNTRNSAITSYNNQAGGGLMRQAWIAALRDRDPFPTPSYAYPLAYSQWKHDGPTPTPDPFTLVDVKHAPARIVPLALPMLMPIGAPAVVLPLLNDWQTTKLARSLGLPEASVSGNSAPAPRADEDTGVRVTVTSDGISPPRVTRTRTRGGRKPPPPRTKSDKKGAIFGTAPVSRLMAAGLSLTEADDLVDSLHAALPASCRTGRGLVGKLTDLARCWDHLDVPTALANIAVNEIEDQLVGRLSGKAGKGLEALIGRRSLILNPL